MSGEAFLGRAGLAGKRAAFFGRFARGARAALSRSAEAAGVCLVTAKEPFDLLVVGAAAHAQIESGALSALLAAKPEAVIHGERGFAALLAGEASRPAAYPLAQALTRAGLSEVDARLLAAFDLIACERAACGFGDVATLIAAGELLAAGRSMAETVRLLQEASLTARGRRKLVVRTSGEAAFDWGAEGLTNLRGQGLLPLADDEAPTLDALFSAAADAESAGDADEAARLYDLCARADRREAVAPYNLGNIRLAEGRFDEAALAYQRALARDPRFAQARYNLAQALEAQGRASAAAAEYEKLLRDDPAHSDALFNLAQMALRAGDLDKARALYERYLAGGPPPDWADKARRALTLCRRGA